MNFRHIFFKIHAQIVTTNITQKTKTLITHLKSSTHNKHDVHLETSFAKFPINGSIEDHKIIEPPS